METTGFCREIQTVNKVKTIGYIRLINSVVYPIFLNDDTSYTSDFLYNNSKFVLNIPFKYKGMINRMVKKDTSINIDIKDNFPEYIYINDKMVENDGIITKRS